jgi:hypothetical protein
MQQTSMSYTAIRRLICHICGNADTEFATYQKFVAHVDEQHIQNKCIHDHKWVQDWIDEIMTKWAPKFLSHKQWLCLLLEKGNSMRPETSFPEQRAFMKKIGVSPDHLHMCSLDIDEALLLAVQQEDKTSSTTPTDSSSSFQHVYEDMKKASPCSRSLDVAIATIINMQRFPDDTSKVKRMALMQWYFVFCEELK